MENRSDYDRKIKEIIDNIIFYSSKYDVFCKALSKLSESRRDRRLIEKAEGLLYNLRYKIYSLEKTLENMRKTNGDRCLGRKVGYDGVVSIYAVDTTKDYVPDYYYIVLEESKECIGTMLLQSSYNIGIRLFEGYRGKGYGYRSLCLLIDFLLGRGVKNFELFARASNLASLRVLEKINEKYGAARIRKDKYETVYYYDYNEKEIGGKRH